MPQVPCSVYIYPTESKVRLGANTQGMHEQINTRSSNNASQWGAWWPLKDSVGRNLTHQCRGQNIKIRQLNLNGLLLAYL